VKKGVPPGKVPIPELQAALVKQGVYLKKG
jgi:hypothetical protein